MDVGFKYKVLPCFSNILFVLSMFSTMILESYLYPNIEYSIHGLQPKVLGSIVGHYKHNGIK